MKVNSGGVELAVYEYGEAHNPTVVLIHGYPDNASVWEGVANALAHNFHVVTYDVRGCGNSFYTPTQKHDFNFEHLSADLRAVIDAVSPNKPVHLVGHDWGALQGWEALLSGRLENRVASWSCAAPPLDHVGFWFHQRIKNPTPRNILQAFGRMLGSSYMLMMQLPFLPELTWRLGLRKI